MPFQYADILDYLKNESIKDIARKSVLDYYQKSYADQIIDDSWKLLELEFAFSRKGYRSDRYKFVRALDGIFKGILKPFPEDGEKKVIYCQLEEQDEESGGEGYTVFSALTKEMIETNREFFSSDKQAATLIDFLYKPYLYQFAVKKVPIDIEKDKWYKVTITNTVKGERCLQSPNHAILCFAASPCIVKDVIFTDWLKATKKEIGWIPKLEDWEVINATDVEIENELKKTFENVSGSSVNIYKFGQANFIHGKNKISGNKREFFFDCGFPTIECLKIDAYGDIDYPGSQIYDGIRKINYCDPKLIMISHWHGDHYRGAFMFQRHVYHDPDLKWIAPYYYVHGKSKSFSADMLIKYLIIKDKIMFVRDDFVGCTIDNYRLSRGTGKDPDDLNVSGLILRTNRAILPGDCACEYWPDYIKNLSTSKIKHICVPHHAAPTTKRSKIGPVIDDVISNKSDRLRAFVCVGYNHFKYPHPSNEVIKKYKEIGFGKVVLTNNSSSYTKFRDK